MVEILFDKLLNLVYNYIMTKKSIWTNENVNFLKNNYASMGSRYCAEQLSCSIGSIQVKANRLGIKSRIHQKKTHAEYEKELMIKEVEYVPLESYIDSQTAILHECFNGHISSVKPYSVLNGSKCRQCNIISKTKTHQQYLVDLEQVQPGVKVLDDYINTKTSIRHMCTKEHIWWARPNSMLREYSHCPECANFTFKLNKPAILYYIKVIKNNLVYYKIGITNRSVDIRFGNESKSTLIKTIKETPYSTGAEAKAEETRLFKKYAEFRQHIPELLVSGGNTELFEFDVLGLDK